MVNPFRAIRDWWREQRLYVQLALLTGLVIAVTLIADAYVHATQRSNLAFQNMQEGALALSRNIATAGAFQVVNNDLAALEEMMLSFIDFPEVQALTITDIEGTPLGNIRNDAQGRARVIYSMERIELPAFLQGADEAVTVVTPPLLQVWQPVRSSTVLGWLQMDYDLSALDEIRTAIWLENFYTSITLIIIDVAVLLMILHMPTRALHRAGNFALGLHRMDGQRLDVTPTSREVNALTSALNQTSQTLYRQNENILQANRELAVSAEQLSAAKENLEEQVRARTGELAETVDQLRREAEERGRVSAELEMKNAELERFTYTVSHDLKSPLVTIEGFTGLLRQDIANQEVERIDDDLDKISDAARTMTRLLEDLLDLSRAGRVIGELKDCKLSDIAHQAVKNLDGKIEKRGIELEIGDMPSARVDSTRMREVFQNLIENAIKFMGEQKTPRIRIGAEVKENMLHCFVSDNGIGIEPKFHQQIFGLFQRLSNDIGGTGIGLALVKRIIEVHGGAVWVESEGPGKGTSMWFSLPRSA